MKCPECAKEGERSQVYCQGGTSTLMGWSPYYDEDGVYHSHDPNGITQIYECSRGHRWTREHTAKCPNCGYGGDESSDGDVYDESARKLND